MGTVMDIRSLHAAPRARAGFQQFAPAIRTSEVHVLFTSMDGTLAAVRIAEELARALGVPLTIVHLRTVPYTVPVDQPAGLSPLETRGFLDTLRAHGYDVQLRVFLCRSLRDAIPQAFRRHSLVVIGGRRGWWAG